LALVERWWTVVWRFAARWLGPLVLLLSVLLVPGGSSRAAPVRFAIGQPVQVQGEGSGVNLRAAPSLGGRVRAMLPNGTQLVITGGPLAADGLTWWEVGGSAGWGWAAEGLLLPGPSASTTLPPGPAGCAPASRTYGGLRHCLLPGNVHVVVIDLADPHIRFETVVAHDAPNPAALPGTERVSAMAARYPGAAAAINGDYFHAGNAGPVGLVVKNGARLDSLPALEHSALAIGTAPADRPGASLPISVQLLEPGASLAALDPAQVFNAVGGGPVVMANGRWQWQHQHHAAGTGPCWRFGLTDWVNGECFPSLDGWLDPAQPWTVVALAADHHMLWVVGPFQHIESTLRGFGAVSAIKLDSAGSSQLWYGRPLIEGYTPVANALLVFYLGSARVLEQPKWPVVMAGEAWRARVVIENTGSDAWPAGSVFLAPLGTGPTPASLALGEAVPPGGQAVFEWPVLPADAPGLYQQQWQLYRGTEPFAETPITVDWVVLPERLRRQRAALAAQALAWHRTDPATVAARLRDALAQNLAR
jgi:hypothetical protein